MIRKMFMVMLLFMGFHAVYAQDLSVEEKKAKTAQYLCDNISSTLCGIYESYATFNAYHKKLRTELNLGKLDTMEDSLPVEVQEALNKFENITSIYNIRNILLTGIKTSKYEDLVNSFDSNSFTRTKTIMYNDNIWIEEEALADKFIENYDNTHEITNPNYYPMYSIIKDSIGQLKVSADLAVSVSRATFLYPYNKTISAVENAKDTFDLIGGGYKTVVDFFIPFFLDIMPKLKDGTFSEDDLRDMIDSVRDISATLNSQFGDSKPAEIIEILSLFTKFIDIVEQQRALYILNNKYKNNPELSHTLSVSEKLISSKTMILSGDILNVIIGLLPSGSSGAEELADIGNNFIKAFMNYELKIRKALYANSLNSEFLEVYVNRVNFASTAFGKFLLRYFDAHITDIIDTQAEGFTTTPREGPLAPIVRFTLPTNATAIDYKLTVPQGKTVSFEPLLSAKDLIVCINTAKIKTFDDGGAYETANADLKWKLWYSDATSGGTEIPLQRDGNSFSFTSPKSSTMVLTSLTYSTEGKKDYRSCPWEDIVWQSVVADGGDSNTTAPATHLLKHTGQTTSYAVGDDAYYHAGKAVHYSRDDVAEVVTDHVTGLEWQDDAEARTITKNWADALTHCENKGNGWRLPTVAELTTIVDYAHRDPSINPIFQNVASYFYWSPTASGGDSSYARYISFIYGAQYDGGKSHKLHVRCVRAGQ